MSAATLTLSADIVSSLIYPSALNNFPTLYSSFNGFNFSFIPDLISLGIVVNASVSCSTPASTFAAPVLKVSAPVFALSMPSFNVVAPADNDAAPPFAELIPSCKYFAPLFNAFTLSGSVDVFSFN